MKGITEDDYLEYGRIWREFGGEDPSASLRQKDQFIFLDNFQRFIQGPAVSGPLNWPDQ